MIPVNPGCILIVPSLQSPKHVQKNQVHGKIQNKHHKTVFAKLRFYMHYQDTKNNVHIDAIFAGFHNKAFASEI